MFTQAQHVHSGTTCSCMCNSLSMVIMFNPYRAYIELITFDFHGICIIQSTMKDELYSVQCTTYYTVCNEQCTMYTII